MPTARETAIAALFALVQAMPGITALRNTAWPERVPAGGLIVVRDGETIEEEAMLSPLAYGIVHRADVEIVAADEAARDAIIAALAAAIAANRTLGGAAEWAEAGSPDYDTVAPEGAASVAAASLPVRLMFTAPDSPAG
ncbi:MAG: hypothetical protein N2688_00170 [Burkholderiaceae bacterium]|nr:hypothetical protein [Burkholderiaceae bacterium]